MQRPEPIVTIIVPGRDVEEFVPAALDSLRSQTETCWRAVLVDDGSVDGTGELFAQAAQEDERFTLVRHEASRGLGAARNAALDLVETPYLGFLDADDEFTPTALERLCGTLERSGSDFVLGAYVRTRPDGAEYVAGPVQPWVAAATSPEQLGTSLREHPEASGNIVAWSKVSRTAFWAGRRFPEGVMYEDQIVAQEMYTQAQAFDVIPDVVVRWRVRASGTSITQGKDRLPVLRDYLAALAGGLEVLRRAGETAAVDARLKLIRAMDLPPLEEIAATHRDPAYGEALEAFVRELDEVRSSPTGRV
ncbi:MULTISPECIES: glycosyltransferase family 2 protein [Arthrobacter]|uniref:Glycosyltransferase family 2 protein n=2 Tax=Arthrobacter TaxID=1663 RepID=A0ABU9KMF9_9MICC|nr:glycosyltransferase family 2 protein [Arthrobacter sp. YJM1]MDP5227982.1 glycosyltransferase family 2 protein [Arthrobacter sp. YJM1]